MLDCYKTCGKMCCMKSNRTIDRSQIASTCSIRGQFGGADEPAANGQQQCNPREGTRLDFIIKMFVKAHNWRRGQTMTEYALILSAVAVVVYSGYRTMGTSITGLLTSVDGNL
jgi:Flp pilus assembly pilin Flp